MPTSRFSTARAVLGATSLLVTAATGVTRAQVVLDQQMATTGRATVAAGLSGTAVPPSQKRAQTFTVGRAGTLSEVDVYLRGFSPGSGTLQFEIRATTATGFPVNDPAFLVQTTKLMTSLPQTGPAFVPF